MKKTCIMLISFLALALGYNYAHCEDHISEGYIPIPIDSLMLDGYKAIRYNYIDSAGRPLDFETGISIYKKDKKLISINEDINELTNLCIDYPYIHDIHDNCYLQDLNKDGLKELVITVGSAGGSCCEGGLKLYSLNDTARLLLEMKPTVAGFDIDDIENDSIPEFITIDDTYTSFLDYPYRAFVRKLIWKWDGSKYRIANGKFEDYLLNPLGPDKMPPPGYSDEPYLVQIHANQFLKVPSFYFWDMVLGYYFIGKPQVGDSLFNVYWRPDIPGKDKYWQELHNRFKADPFRKQIINSDW